MTYRPQFAYRAPAGDFDIVRCVYAFDRSNVDVFSAGTVASGFNSALKIPLVLDNDAAFLLRAIEVAPTLLGIGIQDPHNNSLVDPGQGAGVDNLGLPQSLYGFVWCFGNGPGPVTLDGDEWGVYCAAGSALGLYVNNWTGAQQTAPILSLHGVKRYPRGGCR